MRCVLLLWIGSVAAWGQQATQLASLEGQVVNAKTGEPIRRAQVTLRAVRTGERDNDVSGGAYLTSSGGDGRFQFASVPAGRYILQGERTGFVQQLGGSGGQAATYRNLTLAAGARITDAKVEMLPQGVITGRVSDEEGEPMSGVAIQLMRATYLNGRRQFTGVNSSITNDLGEYRLYGLSKGRYYLCALRRSAAVYGRRAGSPDADENYVPVYYPGSTDTHAAAPLDIVPGSQLQGVDLRLVKARTVRIRGRVAGVDLQETRRGLGVVMMPADGGGSIGRNFSSGPVNPEDGSFEIPGVTPGNYILMADLFQRDERRRLSARLPLTVGNTNIDDANLTLSPGISLTGTIKVEGDTPAAGVNKGIAVTFVPRDSLVTGGGNMAQVQEDLTFSGFSLMPGTYSVTMRGLSPDAYIKSVQFGNAEVRDQPMQITAGAAGPVQITLSFAGAQVEGIVSQGDQPFPNATVALVPADPQRRGLAFLYRTATTDSSGHYLLRGIAPGEYKLFAWDKIEPGAYQSSEFLQPYENDGVAVSVQEQGKETKPLKLLAGGV